MKTKVKRRIARKVPLRSGGLSKWDVLADGWQHSGPPSSPSIEDLFHYRRFIRSNTGHITNPEIMILGCTPGLRLITSELGIRTTCVEKSERMFAVTSKYVKPQNARENYLCENWLQMDAGHARFAIILGDKVFDNVPHAKWPAFKQRIITHLRPQGSFVTRVAPQDLSLMGMSFTELFREWSNRYTEGTVSCRDAASGLWEQLLGASTKSLPGRQTIGVFAKELSVLEKSDSLSRKDLALLKEFRRLFWPGAEFEWTSYSLGNLIDALGDDLYLTGVARSRDYLAGLRQPVLEFQALR